MTEPVADVVASSLVLGLMYLMYRLYRWTRQQSPDTALWGTIFESLTHYIQPMDHLKEPSQEIVKQTRLPGDPPEAPDEPRR